MAYQKRRMGRRRKRVCIFCEEKNNNIDYKDLFLKEEKFFLEE